MSNLEEVLNNAPDNQLIKNTFIKADKLLSFYKNPVCSISGGSDSDIMLDMLEQVRGNRKITYVFFDTGIEYEATKRHLDDLEKKYAIKIERKKAEMPAPAGCKKFGVPFLSKDVSQKISLLQKHGFGFEDLPFEELCSKYKKCTSSISWWCNARTKKYNINSLKLLKEFMIENPPEFKISDQCCDGAKKNTAKKFYKEHHCCLAIVGERRAEGGVRAYSHTTCFESSTKNGIPKYMPLFFWTDEDKKQYKEHYGIVYSDCYEVYGMTRTGCAGCPFNSKFEDALKIIHKYEPKLEIAVNNIFGDSYEYMRKYRAFKELKKSEERSEKASRK